MTIAILEMPISIKLTFGHQGCSGLFCNHNRHCRLFIVPMRPVARRHTVRSRIQASNRAALFHTEAVKHSFVYNFRHQSRLEWSRNPRSFRFPPWQGTSGGQRGVRVDLRSQSSVSKLSQTGKAIAAGLLDAICLIYSAIQQCQ